jgi:hypothetical protein
MKRTHSATWSWFVGLTLVGIAGCYAEEEPDLPSDVAPDALFSLPSDVVIDWNEHTIAAITTHDGYADPLLATRVLALVQIAMHDAINASSHRFYQPYAFAPRDRSAHPVAAAASAAHRVLASLYQAQEAELSAKLADSLAAVADGRGKRRGVALGERVADALLEQRRDDRASETAPYTPGAEPGDYQFTTPNFIFRPGWQNVTPWALGSSDQFRPPPPPALDSVQYAASYNEVRSKGDAKSVTRSADETTYARFWFEFSELGWNRVTRVVARQERLGLVATARLFALVNMALADSYIAGWDAKFHYDFWRPVTAIAAGDSDGNAETAPEPGWAPLLPTPPVQDFPSTHSALGAAAAEVLALYFGRRGDAIGFSMTSTTATEPNVETRTLKSFREAAAENADSRVMAGLHFRFACDAGLELGARIGKHVFDNFLRPRHH